MHLQKPLILVVDDEIEIQRLLQQRFRRKIKAGELDFLFAQNGIEALEILKNSHLIDVIVTDINMPEMDGLTLLKKLSELDLSLKAVVVSAYGDMKNIRTAMNEGAFDFLTKPIDFEDLEATLNKTITFVQNLKEQQKKLEEALIKLHDLVFYDPLTSLPNRNKLLQSLSVLVEKGITQREAFALLLFDVERYTIIKSGFGHSISDLLILEVARRLKSWIHESEELALIGTHEFAILLHQVDSLDCIHKRVEELRQIMEKPFQLEEITVTSTTHVGVALSDLPYTQAEDFLRAADTALNTARQKVAEKLVFFEFHMQQIAIKRLNLEADLQRAIESEQLLLYYQPIFSLKTKEIVGFEALARWQHPLQGWLSPLEFIPLAEETGLIVPLGEWVILEACQQLARWQSQLGDLAPASISVNLSSLQLKSSGLLEHIDKSLKANGLKGANLKLEITESVLMENFQDASHLLEEFRKRQIEISIDDFGTGYSSLAYLQSLPLNILKIDRAFIQDIESKPISLDITSTMISLAHNLSLQVIAEGLEKEVHLEILRSLGCEYGQGFIFSRPLAPEAASDLMQRTTHLS